MFYKIILKNIALRFKLQAGGNFLKETRVKIKRVSKRTFNPGAWTQFWANLTLKCSTWWVLPQARCATCLRPAETIAVGHGSCVRAGSYDCLHTVNLTFHPALNPLLSNRTAYLSLLCEHGPWSRNLLAKCWSNVPTACTSLTHHVSNALLRVVLAKPIYSVVQEHVWVTWLCLLH